MIPLSSPLIENIKHEKAIQAEFCKVLRSGNYILGEQVYIFEDSFSKYIGSNTGVSCNSGTDAILIALLALSIGVGHRVLVPSMTATATITAIKLAGAEPVFCEIDKKTGLIDLQKICLDTLKLADVLLVVHLYGQSIDMEEAVEFCESNGLLLIEDCAQSAGASFKDRKLGTFGDCGCFSFYPTKNLGGLGDGGFCVAKSPEVAAKLRMIRQYGWDENRVSRLVGVNSRLDDIQASILNLKLNQLDSNNQKRRDVAKRYTEALAATSLEPLENVANSMHVYHLFVILCHNRDSLRNFLLENGVCTGIHYENPNHTMPIFADGSALPVTENFCRSILSLPMYPDLSIEDQNFVISKILEYTNGQNVSQN